MEFLAGNRIRGLSSEKNTSLIPVTGLKVYWKFNEASGNIANSATAVGSASAVANSDLVVTGATYGVAGLFGNALSFDGVNDVAITSSATITDWNFLNQTGATWSIIMWIKFDQFTSRFWHISTTNGNGGDTGMSIIGSATPADRTIDVSIMSAGADDFSYTSTTPFDNNTTAFQFMAITYNDATGDLKVKINGNTTETSGGHNLTNTNNAEQNIRIGENSDGVLDTAGDYDEYSIWNRVLSEAELVSLYNSGSGLELDSIPINAVDGSIFYETDTNKSYVLYNGSWTVL